MSSEARSPAPPPDAWLLQLRQRFVSVARRRVAEDDVEDLVQEALVIVAAKGMAEGQLAEDGSPRLAWCFQVLRNVLGNHYQRQRTRGRQTEEVDPERIAEHRTPLEALHQRDVDRHLRACLAELSGEGEVCGPMLQRILDGISPAAIASEMDLEAAVFYRRLYRCRQKLRSLLQRKGVLA